MLLLILRVLIQNTMSHPYINEVKHAIPLAEGSYIIVTLIGPIHMKVWTRDNGIPTRQYINESRYFVSTDLALSDDSMDIIWPVSNASFSPIH